MITVKEIEKLIQKILITSAPDSEVILFGSRAKTTAGPNSDYDFLIIVADTVEKSTRKLISSSIRKKLAEQNIDADIIIQTRSKYNDLRNFPGNVYHWAYSEGIAI